MRGFQRLATIGVD